MNLVYGEIVNSFEEAGTLFGEIRVRGALRRVALALTPEAQPGDRVLVCDGVALNQVKEPGPAEEGGLPYVPGDSR